MATNLTWWWHAIYIQRGAPIHRVTWFFKHVVSQDQVKNKIIHISTGTRLIATKNSKVATYCRWLLSINSQKPFNMWSREVMRQIKNISPLSQSLWSPNLSGWWHPTRSSHLRMCMTPKRGSLVGSRDKLNTLYLHLQKTHGHYTRQGAKLPRRASKIKPTLSFDQLISPLSQVFMATKAGRVLTSGRRFSLQKLESSMVSCSF